MSKAKKVFGVVAGGSVLLLGYGIWRARSASASEIGGVDAYGREIYCDPWPSCRAAHREQFMIEHCAQNPSLPECRDPVQPSGAPLRCAPGWAQRLTPGTPEYESCAEQASQEAGALGPLDEWNGVGIAFSSMTNVGLALPKNLGYRPSPQDHVFSQPSGWAQAERSAQRKYRALSNEAQARQDREDEVRASKFATERGRRELHRPQNRNDWKEQIAFGKQRWRGMNTQTRERVARDWSAIRRFQRRLPPAYSYVWESSDLAGAVRWREKWASFTRYTASQFAPDDRFAPCAEFPARCQVFLKGASYTKAIEERRQVMTDQIKAEMERWAQARGNLSCVRVRTPSMDNCVVDLHVFVAQWFNPEVSRSETEVPPSADDVLLAEVYSSLGDAVTPRFVKRLRSVSMGNRAGLPPRNAARASRVLSYVNPPTNRNQWSSARRRGIERARELMSDAVGQLELADAFKDFYSTHRVAGTDSLTRGPHGYKIYREGEYRGQPYTERQTTVSARGDAFTRDFIAFLAQWRPTSPYALELRPQVLTFTG